MDLVDPDAALLLDLAGDGVLQALARLDEAGQGRVHAGRPGRLAAHQAALAVVDQHDHRRVGAREVRRAAGGIAAAAQVPGLQALGRMAAEAAEAVPRVPVHHASGIGQQRAFPVGEQRADRPDVLEGAVLGQARARLGRLQGRQVEGDVGGLLVEPEQRQPLGLLDQVPGLVGPQEAGARRLDLQEEVALAPDWHQQGPRIGQPLGQPGGIAAPLVGAVQAAAGVEVGLAKVGVEHVSARLAQLRAAGNRGPCAPTASGAVYREGSGEAAALGNVLEQGE